MEVGPKDGKKVAGNNGPSKTPAKQAGGEVSDAQLEEWAQLHLLSMSRMYSTSRNSAELNYLAAEQHTCTLVHHAHSLSLSRMLIHRHVRSTLQKPASSHRFKEDA
jgi:hypothetical protein